MIARGERGTNESDFLNEVLKRVAELTKQGNYEQGSREIDKALAEKARQKAERERERAEEDEADRRENILLLESGVEQDILRRDFKSAAARVATIVDLEHDPAQRFETLREKWHEYYVKGRDKGLNTQLEMSIELARLVSARASDTYARGVAGNDLGVTLQTLGERESGTARLQEAVATFSEALKEITRERFPHVWATTQNNLGEVLRIFGERESGTKKLQEAVEAYREALKEHSREHAPLDWAMTQNNLGNALQTLGARENGTEKLREAVGAYREALKEYTRERVPLYWAATQNNLGNALRTLGERESGKERLQEAVAAFSEALKELTRERVPLQWSMAQNNLGATLQALGVRESSPEMLQGAVDAFRDALKEYVRERFPLNWAVSTGNQGVAMMHLAESLNDAAMATLAQAQIEEAFETCRDGGHGPNASYYEAQLPKVCALVERLRARDSEPDPAK